MMLFSQAEGARNERIRCQTSTSRALILALTLLVFTDVTRSLPQAAPQGQNAADMLTPLPLTTVTADAGQPPANLEAQQSALSRLEALTGVKAPAPPDARQTTPPPAEAAPPPGQSWYDWGRLASAPIACSSISEKLPVPITAFGVHNEDGACVVLWNTSSHPAPFELRLKTGNGVFRIERLCFNPAHPASSTPPADSTAKADRSLPCNASMRRMEGIDSPSPATIVKRGTLAPGEISLIRTTDTAREARLAMMALEQSIKELAQTAPGPAARLRKIQKECDKYVDAIRSGPDSDRQRRLSFIHRLILLYSQAEAQHRNNQSREKVSGDPGNRTMAAVERLEAALAETSAVLSGLVPQLEITGPATGSSSAGEITVQVSLSNSGSRSVDKVKLGLDTRTLPTGVACVPEDAAYFGALGPGQSVRAEFKLKCTAADSAALQDISQKCTADVSYFSNGTPAHLRPKGW